MNHSVKTFKKNGCLSYVITSGNEALVIDPRLDLVEQYQQHATGEGTSITYAVDTHTHADHLSGTSTLAEKNSCKIVMHEKAHSPKVDQRITHHEKLRLGNTEVLFHHTPGHTPDSLSIQIENDLFTGDTVLAGGTGRTDFLGGSPEQMAQSLKKIRDLKNITTIYPGHDYNNLEKTTFQNELNSNPLLSNTNSNEVIATLSSSRPPFPENMKGIIRFNKSGHVGGSELLSADEVSGHSAMGGLIVDVRQVDEFEHGHIEGSISIPLNEIERRHNEFNNADPILVCASGIRSHEAKTKLEALGIRNVRELENGMASWKKAGLPIKQTNRTLPLERQVRIAAGSLALVGALLGYFVNTNFLWLSAFVGAGLVFAGITDTCGMAVLLKKMPWNNNSPSNTSSGCSVSNKGSCAS